MGNDEDPPLGACPPWCEEPAGHPWEDEWFAGPVRVHRWGQTLGKYHTIGVESTEQYADGVTVYHTEVVLDVESPTCWDVDTASRAHLVIAVAINHAKRWQLTMGEGEVR